jgi:hypothetical protein
VIVKALAGEKVEDAVAIPAATTTEAKIETERLPTADKTGNPIFSFERIFAIILTSCIFA